MQQEYTNSQMVALIEEYIHSERDRKILNYEPLAEEFDLTPRQVKNIVYRLQEKLFRHVR